MILHIFCFLVIAVSSAICAPGPEAFQDLSEEGPQNDNRKPSDPQGNLDPIGGPNMVRVDDIDEEDPIFQSLETLDSLQEAFEDLSLEEPQNDNKKPSDPQGNLDSLGGPNFIGASNLGEEHQIVQSVETLDSLQDALAKNLEESPRYGNLTPPPDTRGSLDPIGGDSIVRIVEPDEEDQIFRSLDTSDSLQDSLMESLEELAQYETENGEESLRSLEALENEEDVLVENLEELPRYGNLTPPQDTRGTLDSLGGGNFVRVVETDDGETIFHPLDTSDSLKVDEQDMAE